MRGWALLCLGVTLGLASGAAEGAAVLANHTGLLDCDAPLFKEKALAVADLAATATSLACGIGPQDRDFSLAQHAAQTTVEHNFLVHKERLQKGPWVREADAPEEEVDFDRLREEAATLKEDICDFYDTLSGTIEESLDTVFSPHDLEMIHAFNGRLDALQSTLCHTSESLDSIFGKAALGTVHEVSEWGRVPESWTGLTLYVATLGVSNKLKTAKAALKTRPTLSGKTGKRAGQKASPERKLPPEGHKYFKAPKKLEAFPRAARVKPKNPRQGGTGLRERWEDKKYIYEWDRRHGNVEKYNRQGKHLGEFDGKSGAQIKPRNPNYDQKS